MVDNASEKEVYAILDSIKDPEIPSVSIEELGILRDVKVSGDSVTITITPTYSGCPAMDMISKEVVEALTNSGFPNVEIRRVLSPAWTTDWISESGKLKLKEAGIAPPGKATDPLVSISPKPIPCPRCDSTKTRLTSQFGPTACKALHFCDGCHQPFEHFKDF
ncbi:MAG: phenylacetate-CoA oxygenase subunit PaaJ [Bdellovibrionales bacterium]|nr:phenylacetate-CoA oxygenase subunit PaaJ [Bdellovibrionales bacterium]